jgi:hypothetical protein
LDLAVAITPVNDTGHREFPLATIFAGSPIAIKGSRRTQKPVIVQGLHYRNTVLACCPVNSGGSEREKIVDVDDMRSPSLQLPFERTIASVVPRCTNTDSPLALVRNHAVVKQNLLDLVPATPEKSVLGLTRFILATAYLIFIVNR